VKTIETSLCVVGGGPTGVAALFEAACRGVPALGLEAGASPLASVQAHPEGLTYLSPSVHFEVAGLPLDCGAAHGCTRENLLSYFHRIINYGRLDIRSRHRCQAIRPVPGGVAVSGSGPEGPFRVLARDVILTAWYERRALPDGLLPASSGVEVLAGVTTPATLAGRNVVIHGGGLSLVENASALMLTGQRLCLLFHGNPARFLRRSEFSTLVASTGTRVEAFVTDLQIHDREVSFSSNRGAHRTACDTLVFSAGAVLSAETLNFLRQGKLIDPHLLERLIRAVPVEQATRGPHSLSEQSALRERAIDDWPDLWSLLFDGSQGVRLAGGALHPGASNAGLKTSILTAALAVAAVAGEPVPTGMRRPLPRALTTVVQEGGPAPREKLALVEAVRPLPLARYPGRSPAVRPPELPDDRFRQHLLALADGRRSLGEIGREQALDISGRQGLVAAYRDLWTTGAATWLPPNLGPRQILSQVDLDVGAEMAQTAAAGGVRHFASTSPTRMR
jgi:thioredoxin reductase